VSRPAAEDLRRRLGIDPLLVPNAWDADLAPPQDPTADREVASLLDGARTSLVYTGRFGSYGRDPEPLVRALRELAAREPSVAERLELAVAGPLTPGERRLFGTDVSPVRVTLLGTMSRERALRLQRAADALILVAARKRSQLANLKLFEYLAAGRPILALTAGTEAGRIVREVGAGEVVPSGDVAAIRDALRRLATGKLTSPESEARRAYTYPAAADRMAAAIEEALSRSAR
jgi:glycosyltransferase involved in cell wall biosynthesis